MGVISGVGTILQHQIPDELLRLGRRLQGGVSLEKSVGGRMVMVTGASSGIGKSAAMKIADAGGIVLLVARTREKLEATKEQIEAGGGVAHVHPCDLSDLDDLERMADEVLAQHGHVDVLVNNAGRSIRRSLALSYDRFHDFERTMQLNYFGPVKLISKLLPAMRERHLGHIINVSSIGVQTNMPRFSAYVASKSALDAFSRCIASEVVDDGIDITAIYMPLVRTPMIAPTKMYDRFPTIDPDQAADMICEAIIHRPKRIATPMGTLGQILYALNPRSIDYILNTAYHLFPDSSAAKGEKKEERDKRRARRRDPWHLHRRAGQPPAGGVRLPDARRALVGRCGRGPIAAQARLRGRAGRPRRPRQPAGPEPVLAANARARRRRQAGPDHRRLGGHRRGARLQGGGGGWQRPARRPHPGEARGGRRAHPRRRRRGRTSTLPTSPTSTTSTGWRRRCSTEHGGVDVLVNNAGRSIRRSIALSYDRFHDFERTIQLNYLAAVKLVLHFLPGMRERRSGHIVDVSTMGVQTNVPRFSAYVASKAALDAFARSIASEIVEDRVAISTVYMPLVRTEMIAPTDHYRYFPALSTRRSRRDGRRRDRKAPEEGIDDRRAPLRGDVRHRPPGPGRGRQRRLQALPRHERGEGVLEAGDGG